MHTHTHWQSHVVTLQKFTRAHMHTHRTTLAHVSSIYTHTHTHAGRHRSIMCRSPRDVKGTLPERLANRVKAGIDKCAVFLCCVGARIGTLQAAPGWRGVFVCVCVCVRARARALFCRVLDSCELSHLDITRCQYATIPEICNVKVSRAILSVIHALHMH